MATFKIEVQNKRKDNTFNLRIRVTHNRKLKRISTNIFITPDDLTKSGKIKNQRLIDRCDEILRKCREAVNDLGFEALRYDVDELSDYVKNRLIGKKAFELDFLEYIQSILPALKENTAKCYASAKSALLRFIHPKTKLSIFEIDTKYQKAK